MFCYSIEPFKLGISTDFLCAELPGVVQSSVLCVCVCYILPHLFWLCTHRKQRAKREREREIDRQREKTDVNLTSDLVWQECHTQRRRSRPTASNGVVAYICGFLLLLKPLDLGRRKCAYITQSHSRYIVCGASWIATNYTVRRVLLLYYILSFYILFSCTFEKKQTNPVASFH